jgi:Na+/proline symporter
MGTISQSSGYLLLAIYGVAMVLITWFFARWKKHKSIQGFLVAERNIKWWLGATSIAASWIWAPALFVSVQMAFEKGLPGIFWFTFPNIIALMLFIFLAPKIREKLPMGYTLPQWIKYRLQSEKVHKIYLFPYFFYQLMAVTVQLFAGGSLVSLLTGIPLINAMIIMSIIVLAYSLISGLESSIVTDFIQFILIVLGVVIVIPWVIVAAGGWSAVGAGLGGVTGQFKNIFDPGVAFSYGIVTAIGLISGAISDQQYWQRAFAIKKQNLVPSFIFGAIMFGIVPIALSILGFLAANSTLGITLPAGVDVSMIGISTVSTLLPVTALAVFVIMLLSALFSTLDSGLNAASSLYVTDVIKYSDKEKEVLKKIDEGKQLSNEEASIGKQLDKRGVRNAQIAMIGITVLGFLVALAANFIPGFGLKHLWWIFNTVAACVVVPTVLSLYWSKLDARGVFWGVLIAFVVGIPLFIYGNIVDKPVWIVGASLFIIAISTFFCLIMPKKTAWQPAQKTE